MTGEKKPPTALERLQAEHEARAEARAKHRRALDKYGRAIDQLLGTSSGPLGAYRPAYMPEEEPHEVSEERAAELVGRLTPEEKKALGRYVDSQVERGVAAFLKGAKGAEAEEE